MRSKHIIGSLHFAAALLHCSVATKFIETVDTSLWVGAEFAPSKSANEDCKAEDLSILICSDHRSFERHSDDRNLQNDILGLWHYEWYEPTISRELRLAKQATGLTAVRVFLHSMIFAADNGTTLIASLDDFLGKAAGADIGVGLVFFDDCWNHTGLGKIRYLT
jgi:hypothetical protein